MGKRNRGAGRISAPSTDYRDADANVLTLKGSMSPLTRRKYASTLHNQKVSTDDSGSLFDVVDVDGEPGRHDGSLRATEIFAGTGLPPGFQ